MIYICKPTKDVTQFRQHEQHTSKKIQNLPDVLSECPLKLYLHITKLTLK